MQKSKSHSLSEKDKRKIIDIINSKVTPLKFKYKKLDHKLHALKLPIPPLQKQQSTQLEEERRKKRLSVSTFMNTNFPFRREIIREEEWRKSVLETQTIEKQEEFLNARMSQPILKKASKSSHQHIKSFVECISPYPHQRNDKLMAELRLLEKKKMLKYVKIDLEKKKKQFFDDLLKNKEQNREQKALRKKYQPNSKPSFKQIKNRNTELTELQNEQKNKPFFSSISNISSLRNSIQLVSVLFNEENIQNREFSQIYQQNEIKKLRKFIEFFNHDRDQNKKLKLDHVTKERTEKTSKFINYQVQQFGNNDNQTNLEYQKENNYLFNQRKGVINKTVHFGAQKQRNGFQNGHYQDTELKNAKLRLKANHKKIVSLGKMHKTSNTTCQLQ